ncbi:hypothetical protein D3C81_1567760 [compost metagenome]
MCVHRTPLCQFTGSARGQPYLLVGAQQQDVRQGRFDRVADAPCPIRTRLGDAFFVGALAQVTQMGRVDPQLTGEGTAQRLVGRHQGTQPLVDLAVLAFAALLQGLHHQQADSHAEQGDQNQPGQGGQHALPGTEIDTAHGVASCRRPSSCPSLLPQFHVRHG